MRKNLLQAFAVLLTGVGRLLDSNSGKIQEEKYRLAVCGLRSSDPSFLLYLFLVRRKKATRASQLLEYMYE